jgi:hypothetical protein
METKGSKKSVLEIFDGLSRSIEDPHKRLWVAVILQAMMDALSERNSPEKKAALLWVTKGSNTFNFVCRCAGFHPDWVARKAKGAIARGVKVRADAGTGPRYEERKRYRKKMQEMGIPLRKPYTRNLRLVKPELEDA